MHYAFFGDHELATYLTQLDAAQRVPLTSIDELATTAVPTLIIAQALPLHAGQGDSLMQFVQRSGYLICTGAALASWHEHSALLQLLGVAGAERTQPAELIITPTHEHPALARFESRWTVLDSCLTLAELPADATPLLHTSWRMARYTAAFMRPVGDGCIGVISLGTSAATQADPLFAELIGRMLRAADMPPQRTLNVALLGYGAIGREHGDALAAVEGLRFAAVCDRNPQRLAQAQSQHANIAVYDDLQALLNAPAIDAVIVATPPNTHAVLALHLLEARKHVIVEKPFCLTTAEADDLIATAQANQRMLTVYQNRRWDADFLAIRQLIERGAIGEVFQLETFIGGYGHPCDYWHSDATISGGVFYDWGSHYLDWMLQVLPEAVQQVSATQHKRVWHDVTNADHSTIHLRWASGVEAEFTHSDVAAALKPKWYVLGTQGAIVAQWRHETVKSRRWSGDLIEERLQAAESPSLVALYRRERGDLIHTQQIALPSTPLYPFHRNLADHLLLGLPLAVPPASSRRNIAVMEAATISATRDGAWIEPR